MTTLHWHRPLAHCLGLDAIRGQWQGLLEQHRITPAYEPPRYQDALLSFIGSSPLAPQLKLAAVLALGSTFDFDFRLALGALADPDVLGDLAWPESVAAAVSDNGPALLPATDDAWLGAFIAGRLAGLRETMGHDGTRIEDWHAAFWNRYLVMACRHAWSDGVGLALGHGADLRFDGHAALVAAARGAHRHGVETPADFAPDRTEADFSAILLQLLDAGLPRHEMLELALPAAAAVDNIPMLEFLLAQGAELRKEGGRALAAAGANLACDALAWLLEHGADVQAGEGAVLAAAVASLDEFVVGTVLAAGADRHTGATLAFRTALTANPWDLYSAETDFTARRGAMIALLLEHGVRPPFDDMAKALRQAPGGKRILDAAVGNEETGAGTARLLQALGAEAFGPGPGR